MNINSLKFEFIFALRSAGITDTRLLTVMETIPREQFISPNFKPHAYADVALPIGCGQTTTQPSVVGIMVQALDATPRCKVLEVGSGSGYQTAILSRLARRIYSLERFSELAFSTKKLIEQLNISNVTILFKDGSSGLSEQAPFDRIIVSAATDDIPKILLDQLKPNGILVAPVGKSDAVQKLIKVEKLEDRYNYIELKTVRFLPIIEGKDYNEISKNPL